MKDIKRENKVFAKWLDGFKQFDYYYKYMSYNSALLCLNNNNICFSQPSNWDDQYEKRFYDACYLKKDKRNIINLPRLYACCFTSKQDNEAAWKIYSHSNSDSKVVEFKLNFRKLYEQLLIHLKDCVLYIGSVKYRNKKIIDNLHLRKITIKEWLNKAKESDNPYYFYYFDDFSNECFLELMLLKRDAFEHEKEIRLFVVPNSRDSSGKIKLVSINWIDIIEEIRISDNCTIKEKNDLQYLLNQLLENKKKEFNMGLNKCMEEGGDIKRYLSNTFVHSDWDNGTEEDYRKGIAERIDDYFTNLKIKIQLIDYNIYTSDDHNLEIILD